MQLGAWWNSVAPGRGGALARRKGASGVCSPAAPRLYLGHFAGAFVVCALTVWLGADHLRRYVEGSYAAGRASILYEPLR
jgi:hypothetical protein